MSKLPKRCTWVWEMSKDEVILKERRDWVLLIEGLFTSRPLESVLLRLPGGYRLWSRVLIWIDKTDTTVLRLPITAEQRQVLDTDGWWDYLDEPDGDE